VALVSRPEMSQLRVDIANLEFYKNSPHPDIYLFSSGSSVPSVTRQVFLDHHPVLCQQTYSQYILKAPDTSSIMGFKVATLWQAPEINPVNGKAHSIPILNPINKYGRVFFFAWFGFMIAFLSWYAFPPLVRIETLTQYVHPMSNTF
jgi:hypothetical protein